MKRTVPLIITFLAGVVLIYAYFSPAAAGLSDLSLIHFDILAAIAFLLGGGNLLRMHGEKVYKQQAGWGYSLIAIVAFLTTLGFGLCKVGVTGRPGYWTHLTGAGQAVGLVNLDIADERHTLTLTVRRAEPGSTHAVRLGQREIGQIEVDRDGRGDLVVKYDPPKKMAGEFLKSVREGDTLAVGALLQGTLQRYAPITGDYNQNGSAFWFMYEYGFRPAVQTTFAMLAFYVASAAFRAFRARNIESVLLLGTAFVILLGRTFVGAWISQGLVDPSQAPQNTWEQFLSFWYIPNLTGWLMSVFNTAGNRAIMIGIALGIAATSLRVLLGIDRSYLGSEKG